MAANATTPTRINDQDSRFLDGIHGAIATVQAWDADPALLSKCRAQIPLDEIQNYTRDDDVFYTGNALFLKRLTLYFKEKCMTWINSPPCTNCGSDRTELQTTRGPTSQEEKEGGASRVEVYRCTSCQDSSTTFPRYNSVAKLLETRQGRCGEFANLFGLYCRSVGFETRYISDFTDHVWIECLIDNQYWIMADPCEGLIDKNSMYEDGWGKSLNYILGVTTDSIVDVTPRYTRQWFSPDFQAQRRGVCSSEQVSDHFLQEANTKLRIRCGKSRIDELDRHMEREQRVLNTNKQATEWTDEEKHSQGRISGSLQWKLARHEAGTNSEESKDVESSVTVQTWYVEAFYPPSCNNGISISITPKDGIVVSGAHCSVVGSPLAVVVLDEEYFGCVLQSRGFQSWRDVSDFCQTLPKYRIVAIQGRRQVHDTNVDDQDAETKGLSRLGGFATPNKDDDGLLFLGQVEASPLWARCISYQHQLTPGINITFSSSELKETLKLRTERDTVPRRVAGRLPELVMPLQTQLLASEEQKRTAFLGFTKERSNTNYAGYCTKPNSPVYLLDENAYPFAESDGGWNTFHFLPSPLVPEDDIGIVEKTVNARPKVDIPLDTTFFTSLLGPNLLVNSSPRISPVLVDIPDALHNTRLVAFYFSAHWCGPCRQFTPMLAELYTHLKDEFPTHGLEIVFVSSDRDASGFQQYYESMPWMAVPFATPTIPQIKHRFGVKGIPALVVLDAMSGQIVVPISQSRAEVMQACQGGDEGVEELLQSWIAQIPPESQEIMAMLELSCDDNTNGDMKEKEHPYLTRSKPQNEDPSASVRGPSDLIKEMFDKLVADGFEPNAAAVKAIQAVAEQQKNATKAPSSFETGPLNDAAWQETEGASTRSAEEVASNVVLLNDSGNSSVHTVISTVIKYLENAKREPWTPKFRSFRLCNKIVDRITRIQGALDLLCSLGLNIYPTETDFMACIPLSTDLAQMEKAMADVLAKFPRD